MNSDPKSRAIDFERFGPPAEVARLSTGACVPQPGPGQLLLRILYSPINPADLNVLAGTYGVRPELPATPGGEASARVLAVGDSLAESFEEGDLVILMRRLGCWCDHLVVEAEAVRKIAEDIDPVQASMLSVNPPTAWLLLRQFLELQPGEWIVQNAANSGVGRCVIQIARALGIHTANVVRREDVISELSELGADVVFLDDPDGAAQAREKLQARPRLAFNAVGGVSALRLMDLLAPGGVHVTYGAMSRESLKVPNKFLIFKNLELRGLWVTKWIESASAAALDALFSQLTGMLKEGTLVQPVERIYPPEEIKEALQRAAESGRGGKILLGFCN